MTKKQWQNRERLLANLARLGFTKVESNALRRIELTLSRWDELECGTGDADMTRSIERDEKSGKPFFRVQFHGPCGKWIDNCSPIADREAGALKRLVKIVAARNARFVGCNGVADDIVLPYHQGDPRGCSLFIVRQSDIGDGDINSLYTRGVAVCD
jgi:hypothetical protein